MASTSKSNGICGLLVLLVLMFIIGRPYLYGTCDLYYHEIDEFSHVRGDYTGASVETDCFIKGYTNCTRTKSLEYPRVSFYILLTNHITPIVHLATLSCVRVSEDYGAVFSLSSIILLETMLFTNSIIFATVVGPAVGFKASDLTPLFYCLTIVSGILPVAAFVAGIVLVALALHKWCKSRHTSEKASSLVRVCYKETATIDIDLGHDENKVNYTIIADPLNINQKDELQAILEPLWKEHAHFIGEGKDAQGLRHNGLHIQNVRRVNNSHVLRLYSCRRNTIRKFAASVGGTLKGLNEYQLFPAPKLVPTINIPFAETETNSVDKTINEYYLFHGTESTKAESIAKQGFVVDNCRRAMLGRGIYFTDSLVKADQYTSPDVNGLCCVILARVLLGDFVVAKDTSAIPSTSQQPPCKKCLEKDCKGKHKNERPRFDSVVYTGGLFREFVVFDNWQAYPEYLIYYKRV